MSSPLYAAIEAGGTKVVCAVGTGPDDLRDIIRIPTTDPNSTLSEVRAYLKSAQSRYGLIDAIGIGTFGPAGVRSESPDFGWITTTPKPGWADTDVIGFLQRDFPVPMGFDTDVNAAALGEWLWGAGRGCESVLYLTVGTGIGGGFCFQGKPLHGLLHPEMGHIRIPHEQSRDPFPGACPWHGDCLEGLASGFAMEKRWQQKGSELPPEHPAWELEAHYLGLACANFICTLSPQKLILGGGVMDAPGLMDRVRSATQASLAGYVRHEHTGNRISELITAPGLRNRSGISGAMALAANALTS